MDYIIDKEYVEKLFRELYFSEISRKDNIISQTLVIHSLILTLVAGVFVFFIFNIPDIENSCLVCILKILIFIGITIVSLALVLSIYPIIGFRYQYLPNPKELNDYIIDLQNKYKSKDEAKLLIENKLRSYLIKQYIKLGDANANTNDKRTKLKTLINYLLNITYIIIAINLFIFYFLRI